MMQHRLFWLSGFLSFFVIVEPAPVDALLMAALVLGVLSLRLQWRRDFACPLALVALFIACNVIPFFYPGVRDEERGVFYFLISCYLIAAHLFIAGVSGTQPDQMFRTFILGCALGAIVSTALGFLGMIGVLPAIGDLAKVPGRLQGFFKDPNVYGPSLVPILLYALALVSPSQDARRNLVLLSLAALCALGIVLSFSRAAWLNCFVSLAVFLFIRGRETVKPLLRLAVLCGAIVLATASSMLGAWEDVSGLFLARLELQSYDEDRFAVQEAAVDQFFSEPSGVGPGQAEVLFQYAAHSLYARLLLENGALGALAMLMLLLHGSLRASICALRDPSSVAACIVAATLAGLLVNSFFIDTLHWRHLWIYLGFAYGVRMHAHNVPHYQGGTRWRPVTSA